MATPSVLPTWKQFAMMVVAAAILYLWIENDPEVGGALLLLLVLTMLIGRGKVSTLT
jgi:hypothetical protein